MNFYSRAQDEVSMQDKLELARKQREARTSHQATSASAAGVMISPRKDKTESRKNKNPNWL
jgi:hypothetical protein